MNYFGEDKEAIRGKNWDWKNFESTNGYPVSDNLLDWVIGQEGALDECYLCLDEWVHKLKNLKEENWYRYHDLFAEMLSDQLKTRYPQEVPALHLKAAKWYNDNHAPADAISHLLAAKAWEEAAILIEEAALRELEQFGEDGRCGSYRK